MDHEHLIHHEQWKEGMAISWILALAARETKNLTPGAAIDQAPCDQGSKGEASKGQALNGPRSKEQRRHDLHIF